MSESLRPKNHAERVALFRAQVLGPILNRTLARGELGEELERLSQRRFRAPDSTTTRTYSVPTLRRWHQRFRKGGLTALTPVSRALGSALALTEAKRKLLLEIRREHRSAAVTMILETLQSEGRLEPGEVSAETLRRLYRREGLTRLSRRRAKQDLDSSSRVCSQAGRGQAPAGFQVDRPWPDHPPTKGRPPPDHAPTSVGRVGRHRRP